MCTECRQRSLLLFASALQNRRQPLLVSLLLHDAIPMATTTQVCCQSFLYWLRLFICIPHLRESYTLPCRLKHGWRGCVVVCWPRASLPFLQHLLMCRIQGSTARKMKKSIKSKSCDRRWWQWPVVLEDCQDTTVTLKSLETPSNPDTSPTQWLTVSFSSADLDLWAD